MPVLLAVRSAYQCTRLYEYPYAPDGTLVHPGNRSSYSILTSVRQPGTGKTIELFQQKIS